MSGSFATRLSGLRQRAGLTQRGLAFLARLDPKHVSMLEIKSPQGVSMSTVSALAGVIGCTSDHLWADKGRGPTDDEIKAAVAAARARRPQPPSNLRSDDEIVATLKASSSFKEAVQNLGYKSKSTLYFRARKSAAVRAALAPFRSRGNRPNDSQPPNEAAGARE